VLEVEDRGPGVPARERRSIFRAFRRGRSADVTAGGVGLGLALAGQWVRLLGGRLRLAETPAAGGACFRVTLPASPVSGCRS
jgi:signal transduction histidine kinase